MEKLQVTINMSSDDFVLLMVDYVDRVELVRVSVVDAVPDQPTRKKKSFLTRDQVAVIARSRKSAQEIMELYGISRATYDRVKSGQHRYQLNPLEPENAGG